MWATIGGTDKAPTGRAFHATCVIGTAIYVFGGTNGTKVFNDLYRFDTGRQDIALLIVCSRSILPPLYRNKCLGRNHPRRRCRVLATSLFWSWLCLC